jgi:hypothetical protein
MNSFNIGITFTPSHREKTHCLRAGSLLLENAPLLTLVSLHMHASALHHPLSAPIHHPTASFLPHQHAFSN